MTYRVDFNGYSNEYREDQVEENLKVIAKFWKPNSLVETLLPYQVWMLLAPWLGYDQNHYLQNWTLKRTFLLGVQSQIPVRLRDLWIEAARNYDHYHSDKIITSRLTWPTH